MKPMFNPSLTCIDLLNTKEQLQILNTRADLYHVDIVDGYCAKNIILSPDFYRTIRPMCRILLDCHLMVTTPDGFIEPLVKTGVGFVYPHAKTTNTDISRIMDEIHSPGRKVGVVLNPATPVSYIQHYIHLLDKMMAMTVDPGFAGRPSIKEMLDKINELKVLKEERGYKYPIEVDGSCNEKIFGDPTRTGTGVFIVGTSDLLHLDPDLVTAWGKTMDNFSKAVGR